MKWKKLIIWSLVELIFVVVALVAAAYFLIWHTPMAIAKLTKTTQPTVVYDKNGAVFMKIGSAPTTLTYQQIPDNLRNAIVATEDHGFWDGSSIDVRSVIRSVIVDVVHGSATEGASTIQEQLAKIVYLNDNKTLSYKLKEMVLGLKIDRSFSKQQILAMYLNKVFLGENAVGVEQAAERYFGVNLSVHPEDLTLADAALLAGLPQAPTAYDPLKNPHAALTRRNQVLENMAKYGYITEAQAGQAESQALGVSYHPLLQDAWNTHPLFTNFLFDYASKEGITPAQIMNGGLKIYTTVNPNVQNAVDKVFWSDNYNGDFPGGASGTVVEGAGVFVDPKSGGILGAAGSRKQDYVPFGMDRVYANTSPGSSIKPIMEYAPAIESGKWTPTSVLKNGPQDFGGGYIPSNWEGDGPSLVTLQYGLQWSQNIASVWLLQQIGLQTGTQFAMNDGIKLTQNDREHLGVAIGGMDYGVNPLEMAQAYEPFDDDGVQEKAHLITHIVNAENQTIYQFAPVSKTIMTPQTAATMTGLLQDVVDFGTGTRAQIDGWGVAGKTGTVQYDSGLNSSEPNWIKDAWFDGYTPNIVGSVYIGYDKSSAENHMTMSPLDPSANAAQIFGDIVRMAEQGNTPMQFATGPFPAWQGTATAVADLGLNQGINSASAQTGPPGGQPPGKQEPPGQQGKPDRKAGHHRHGKHGG